MLGVLGLVLIGAGNYNALFGGQRMQNNGGGEQPKPAPPAPGSSQSVPNEGSQVKSAMQREPKAAPNVRSLLTSTEPCTDQLDEETGRSPTKTSDGQPDIVAMTDNFILNYEAKQARTLAGTCIHVRKLLATNRCSFPVRVTCFDVLNSDNSPGTRVCDDDSCTIAASQSVTFPRRGRGSYPSAFCRAQHIVCECPINVLNAWPLIFARKRGSKHTPLDFG